MYKATSEEAIDYEQNAVGRLTSWVEKNKEELMTNRLASAEELHDTSGAWSVDEESTSQMKSGGLEIGTSEALRSPFLNSQHNYSTRMSRPTMQFSPS